MKTYMANPDKIERKWYVVDAEGQTLGRMASEIAKVLRGKNKPEFTPHVDTGDYVVVVNAEKVKVSGKKLQQKIYYNHSDYVGGMRHNSGRIACQEAGKSCRTCSQRNASERTVGKTDAQEAARIRRTGARSAGSETRSIDILRKG